MARILIVDDDVVGAECLNAILAENGHEPMVCANGLAAMEDGLTFAPDLLVSDWLLTDGTDGIVVARSLRESFPKLPALFISGLPKGQLESALGWLTNFEVLEKPFEIDAFLGAVKRLVNR